MTDRRTDGQAITYRVLNIYAVCANSANMDQYYVTVNVEKS